MTAQHTFTMPTILLAMSIGGLEPTIAAQLPASGCEKLKNSLSIGDCLARKVAEKLRGSYKWQVGPDTSKLSDQKSVYLITRSQNKISCRRKLETRAFLTIRCQENTTAMLLNVEGCQMVSNVSDYGTVTIRLDKQAPRSIAMEESMDEEALGLWKGRKSIPIIKTMFDKSQLTVRMTPHSQSPVTATFDISGLDEAIKPLRKACGW